MYKSSKKIAFIPNYTEDGYLKVGEMLRNDFSDIGQDWDIFPHVDAIDEPGQFFLTRPPLPDNEPENRSPLFSGYKLAPISTFVNPKLSTAVIYAFQPSNDVVQIEIYDSIGGARVNRTEQYPNWECAIVLEFFPI